MVVHGTGGAGKSQLVLNYVQQHRRDHAAVFWIEAATKAAVERDFVQIYQLLYDVHNVAGVGSTQVEDAVPAVKRWFYRRQKRWLFVFDSADNVEHEEEPSYVDLRYFLPDDPSVDIVITTRNASTRKMSRLEGLEVAEMAPEEAKMLFVKQAEMTATTSEQEREVAAIVDELGCLALAVTLAGSYVAATPRLTGDITQYLPEYRRRRKELLNQKPERLVHQYGASVLTTWETSFKAVERQDRRAGHFLSLLGFLHWDDIFMSLFEVEEEEDDVTWTSILFSSGGVSTYEIEGFFAILRTYSLVKFQPSSSSYSMHRLIHTWTFDRLSIEEQKGYIYMSILLLGQALDNEQHHFPAMKVRLIPHLMSSFTMVSTNLDSQGPVSKMTLRYFGRMTRYLYLAGRWHDTLLIGKTALKRTQALYGEEHLNTISAMSNVAITLESVGDIQGALTMKREVVKKRKQILGEEHPDTITAISNLAITLESVGDIQGALTMKREVVKKMIQILGEEHPDTITVVNNLATSLGNVGDLQRALAMKREVVEKRKQILEEEHPDTISAMNNLAKTLSNVGDIKGALSIQQEVVKKRKQILGEEHPDTISAMNDLAKTLSDVGDLRRALAMKREVVEKMKQILGEEHPDTISAMSNLAIILGDVGDLQGALTIQHEVLTKIIQILGEEHPNTIIVMNNLAKTLSNVGDIKGALSIQQEVVKKRKQILGEEHPDTISAMNDLAKTLSDVGDLRRALAMKREVVKKRKQILGEEHPDIIMAMNNLAVTLGDVGDLQGAFTMQREVVAKMKQILGEEHPKTVAAMQNLQVMIGRIKKLQHPTSEADVSGWRSKLRAVFSSRNRRE